MFEIFCTFAPAKVLSRMNHPNMLLMSEKELESRINEGLKITHRKVVEQHRRDNQPLIFSENGVVQFVDPYSVQI